MSPLASSAKISPLALRSQKFGFAGKTTNFVRHMASANAAVTFDITNDLAKDFADELNNAFTK